MPQEPKKRHSRQRQGKRRASIIHTAPRAILCPNCKIITLPHIVCKACGFYKGAIVIQKKVKEEETKTQTAA